MSRDLAGFRHTFRFHFFLPSVPSLHADFPFLPSSCRCPHFFHSLPTAGKQYQAKNDPIACELLLKSQRDRWGGSGAQGNAGSKGHAPYVRFMMLLLIAFMLSLLQGRKSVEDRACPTQPSPSSRSPPELTHSRLPPFCSFPRAAKSPTRSSQRIACPTFTSSTKRPRRRSTSSRTTRPRMRPSTCRFSCSASPSTRPPSFSGATRSTRSTCPSRSPGVSPLARRWWSRLDQTLVRALLLQVWLLKCLGCFSMGNAAAPPVIVKHGEKDFEPAQGSRSPPLQSSPFYRVPWSGRLTHPVRYHFRCLDRVVCPVLPLKLPLFSRCVVCSLPPPCPPPFLLSESRCLTPFPTFTDCAVRPAQKNAEPYRS